MAGNSKVIKNQQQQLFQEGFHVLKDFVNVRHEALERKMGKMDEQIQYFEEMKNLIKASFTNVDVMLGPNKEYSELMPQFGEQLWTENGRDDDEIARYDDEVGKEEYVGPPVYVEDPYDLWKEAMNEREVVEITKQEEGLMFHSGVFFGGSGSILGEQKASVEGEEFEPFNTRLRGGISNLWRIVYLIEETKHLALLPLHESRVGIPKTVKKKLQTEMLLVFDPGGEEGKVQLLSTLKAFISSPQKDVFVEDKLKTEVYGVLQQFTFDSGGPMPKKILVEGLRFQEFHNP